MSTSTSTSTDTATGTVLVDGMVVTPDHPGGRLHFWGCCTHFYDDRPPRRATYVEQADEDGKPWCADCIATASMMLGHYLREHLAMRRPVVTVAAQEPV